MIGRILGRRDRAIVVGRRCRRRHGRRHRCARRLSDHGLAQALRWCEHGVSRLVDEVEARNALDEWSVDLGSACSNRSRPWVEAVETTAFESSSRPRSARSSPRSAATRRGTGERHLATKRQVVGFRAFRSSPTQGTVAISRAVTIRRCSRARSTSGRAELRPECHAWVAQSFLRTL